MVLTRRGIPIDNRPSLPFCKIYSNAYTPPPLPFTLPKLEVMMQFQNPFIEGITGQSFRFMSIFLLIGIVNKNI